MTTMIEAKGAEYVTRWPAAVATRAGLSVEYVATAITDITGTAVDRSAMYEPTAHPAVGALTGEQAKAVVTRLGEIGRGITRDQRTGCRYCGLPLVDGACQECV